MSWIPSRHPPARVDGTTVDVWRVDVAAAVGWRGFIATLATGGEWERAGGFVREWDGLRHLVARASRRHLLGAYADLPAASLDIRQEVGGKPYLAGDAAGLRFSTSYARGVVVHAVAVGAEVGVDVEDVRDGWRELAGLVMTPHELARIELSPKGGRDLLFCELWTRKEAYLKALGLGLRDVHLPDVPADDSWEGTFRPLRPAPGVAGCLAQAGEPRPVRLFELAGP